MASSTAFASAYSVIGLRFVRTGTGASSVKLTVVDENGAEINGAAATLTTTHDFKPTGSNVTESILCPNVNGNSSPTIVLTFNVTGLPETMNYNNVGLDIHALNAGGSYQQNNDGKARRFNVSVETGANPDVLAAFALLSDIDIAAGVGASGAVHQTWNATSSAAATAGNALTVRLTITKGSSNQGCFFGLSSVTLSSGDAPEVPEVPEEPEEIEQGCYYYITWSQDASLYMTEEGDGSLVVSGQDVAQRQFWQFVPTGKENCYYIKNAVTGRYIQSSNLENSSASRVDAGQEPVEYYVAQSTAATSSVRGCYRFTSTDCPDYDNSGAAPHGLNKDGASSNVIVWMAAESNTGSWWRLAKTEMLYDLRPFSFSDALGKPRALYAIASVKTGKVLQMAEDGALSWAERNEADNQAWYFVGTSNSGGGFLIANLATGKTIDVAGSAATRWYVLEGGLEETGYMLRPFASKDDAEATFSVEGESLVLFRSMRSKFSRSAQIYEMPCGALGAVYVAKATVSGGLVPMTYPLPTYSGTSVSQPSASLPSSWYTLYTQDKATVVRGSTFNLSITLNQKPLTGQTAYVYFDWNRDGIYEVSQELSLGQEMNAMVTVPEEAKNGQSRVRFRLTDNGLSDAEDEVTGQILDFIINVVSEVTDTYTYSAVTSDPLRGTAIIDDANGLDALSAQASPLGDASFLCWKEGKKAVSAQATYVFALDHNTHLTAYFTPNTDATISGIDLSQCNKENFLVDVTADRSSITVQTAADVRLVLVYSTDGQLVGRSVTKHVSCPSILPGTYVVKVFTAEKDLAQKVLVK